MSTLGAVLTALVRDRALCLHCIAAKTRVTPADLETALVKLGEIFCLHRSHGRRCRACGGNPSSTVSLD